MVVMVEATIIIYSHNYFDSENQNQTGYRGNGYRGSVFGVVTRVAPARKVSVVVAGLRETLFH